MKLVSELEILAREDFLITITENYFFFSFWFEGARLKIYSHGAFTSLTPLLAG